MRNYQICPRPILKEKPKSQQLKISSISPQPPTVHREVTAPPRDNLSPNPVKSRDKLSLNQAIDYDKLTPSQQLKWDAGIYGAVTLRTDGKTPCYCVRWTDPISKRRRSTKLDSDYDRAIAKLKQLTIQS